MSAGLAGVPSRHSRQRRWHSSACCASAASDTWLPCVCLHGCARPRGWCLDLLLAPRGGHCRQPRWPCAWRSEATRPCWRDRPRRCPDRRSLPADVHRCAFTTSSSSAAVSWNRGFESSCTGQLPSRPSGTRRSRVPARRGQVPALRRGSRRARTAMGSVQRPYGPRRELHRVEQALYSVESESELVGDVLHDDLSLEDSGLRNSFTLRRMIRDGLRAISPGASQALLRPVPELPAASAITEAATAGGTEGSASLFNAEALESLHEVRFAINDYRDYIIYIFALGKNKLIWTFLAVALTTYALIGLGLIFCIPKEALVSVSVLYLVSSVVGRFNRLRNRVLAIVDHRGLRPVSGSSADRSVALGACSIAGVYVIVQASAFLVPLERGDDHDRSGSNRPRCRVQPHHGPVGTPGCCRVQPLTELADDSAPAVCLPSRTRPAAH